jgi:N-acyl-L-homoserine lactone synthetase
MQDSPVRYVINPSRDQLEDYFRMRHVCFREVMHWGNFSGAEDDYDRYARFILALNGKEQVVGGVRLIIHEPGSNTRLSLEGKDFVLDDVFPHLWLPEKSYFEAGRLAFIRSFRQHQIVVALVRQVLGLGQALGCQYLFASSPTAQTRYYRQILHELGAIFKIHKTPMPDKPLYEGTAHYLGFLDLQAAPDYRLSLPAADTAA